MGWLSDMVWDRGERLRAGWRVALQLGMWLTLSAAINVVLGGPLAAGLLARFPAMGTGIVQLGFVLSTCLGAIVSTAMAVRWLDLRPFAELGLHVDRNWWVDLAFGLGLGAGLMTLVFLAEWLCGWVTVRGVFQVTSGELPFAVAILGPILAFVAVGFYEELIFRGYQLRNLAEGLNQPAIGPGLAIAYSWIVSSALFGLLHVFNPDSSWVSTLNLAFAGLWLGLGYVLTGSLAIPIGLHITWNLFQGNVFGFPVSGIDYSGATVFAIEQSGPPAWTGGSFGPEAGLIGVIAILVGVVLTLGWVRWRYGAVDFHWPLATYRPPADPCSSDQVRGDQPT